MNRLVSIIIPTYNRKDEILDCLVSIYKLSYSNFEVIVIDNGSTDKTSDAIKTYYPSVKLIEFAENLGAVSARNIGIENAKGEYLLFVDSDNILDTNVLKELVCLAETDEKIGFIGPKMFFYSDPERIWYAGAKINLLTSKTTYIGMNEIDYGQYDQVKEVEHIPNVWMVKRGVINKIGGLDPIYIMTYGESDWAMRAIKSGFKVILCPKAKVWHNYPLPKDQSGLRATIGFDNPYRIYYVAKNRTIFMKRFSSILNFYIFILIFNNLFLIVYFFYFLRYRKYILIKNYLKGYIDGLKLIKKIDKYDL